MCGASPVFPGRERPVRGEPRLPHLAPSSSPEPDPAALPPDFSRFLSSLARPLTVTFSILIGTTGLSLFVCTFEMAVTTSSPYEAAAFGSKTEWRVRAISAVGKSQWGPLGRFPTTEVPSNINNNRDALSNVNMCHVSLSKCL